MFLSQDFLDSVDLHVFKHDELEDFSSEVQLPNMFVLQLKELGYETKTAVPNILTQYVFYLFLQITIRYNGQYNTTILGRQKFLFNNSLF
jgi:hypothetical protein